MRPQKRSSEPPCRFTAEPPAKKLCRGEFKDEENARLLDALLKHGPNDIKKLVSLVGTRNEYQVKQKLQALQTKAQLSLVSVTTKDKNGMVKYLPRERVAIDKWLDHLVYLHDKAVIEKGPQEELPVRMIARCMGYIANYEDHPEPKECGGVNMKNVYGFLQNMLMGLPFKHLNSHDAEFLLGGLQFLSVVLDHVNFSREKNFVLYGCPQWHLSGKRIRKYGLDNSDYVERDEGIQFLSSAQYNPFKIPSEWCKKSIEIDNL